MKIARHAEILRLIKEYDIETQEELAARLKESGFSATQATVSRDIRELRLTKTASEKGRMRYIALQKNENEADGKYVRTLKDAVIEVETAENLVVVKTESGMAMASAAALDELSIHGIIGSIAGDNTIFLATKSGDDAEKVRESILSLIE